MEWIPIVAPIWGIPKIRGTFVGSHNKDYRYFGVYNGGPLILGNYHMAPNTKVVSTIHCIAYLLFLLAAPASQGRRVWV